jgi:hypothetical protein
MVTPVTSELRALDRAGNALAAPREWAPGLVEVPVEPGSWEEARLDRDGSELPLSLRLVSGSQRVVAEWPRSGTGHYELRLSLAGAPVEAVTWTIEPEKISLAAYLRMLEDLELRLPVSIALGLRRLGTLTGLHFAEPAESTLAQEMTRLRRAVLGSPTRPGLGEVLSAVARDPHRVLSTSEAWVPRERARRIDPSLLPRVLAGGSNLAADRLPVKLPEARVDETVDVYENRLLATFHEQTEERLRRLRTVLVRTRRSSLLGECDDLLARLSRGRREARFLDEVGALTHRPERLTMALLRRPEYRYALEGYLELHRSAVARLDEPDLDAPLEQLPALYQTWGVLQVLDVLLAVAEEEGFEVRSQRVVSLEPGGIFVRVLADGKPAVTLRRDVDGTEVKLIPQRTYTPSGDDYRSISYRQRPDVALEVEREGERGRILLFDPKYKLTSDGSGGGAGRPKKIDIDAMHAYRDSIRDADGERVVEFAAILYPGADTRFDPGLCALSAVPGEEADLREELRRELSAALASP